MLEDWGSFIFGVAIFHIHHRVADGSEQFDLRLVKEGLVGLLAQMRKSVKVVSALELVLDCLGKFFHGRAHILHVVDALALCLGIQHQLCGLFEEQLRSGSHCGWMRAPCKQNLRPLILACALFSQMVVSQLEVFKGVGAFRGVNVRHIAMSVIS